MFTIESELDNYGSEDTSASDFDEQGSVDSHTKTALLTAAIGGDVIEYYACFAGLAGMKTISHYPEPHDHNETLATPGNDGLKFASMKWTSF